MLNFLSDWNSWTYHNFYCECLMISFSVRPKSLLPARVTPTVLATPWWARGFRGGRSNPKSPLSIPFRWRKLPVPQNQTHPPPQEAMPMPKTTLLPLPHPQSCKTESKRRRRSPHQRRNGKGYCRPQAGDQVIYTPPSRLLIMPKILIPQATLSITCFSGPVFGNSRPSGCAETLRFLLEFHRVLFNFRRILQAFQ